MQRQFTAALQLEAGKLQHNCFGLISKQIQKATPTRKLGARVTGPTLYVGPCKRYGQVAAAQSDGWEAMNAGLNPGSS